MFDNNWRHVQEAGCTCVTSCSSNNGNRQHFSVLAKIFRMHNKRKWARLEIQSLTSLHLKVLIVRIGTIQLEHFKIYTTHNKEMEYSGFYGVNKLEKKKSDYTPSFVNYPLTHNEQYSAGGRPFFQQDLIPSPESSDLGSKGLSDSLGRVHFSRSVLDLLEPGRLRGE